MLLSAQLLADVADVNHWRVVNQVEARAGSTIDVWLRLVDREADKQNSPPGRRYMPGPRSVLTCSLKSASPRKQLAFQATQPFPNDPGVWHFQIQPNDGKVAPAPGGGPIIDYSNLVPLGQPFDFNAAITDYGMVGTFGIILTLTERLTYTATLTLNGVQAGDQVDINGVTFLAVAAGATGTQFDVGGSDSITATNLAAAIAANAQAQVGAVANGTSIALTSLGTATISLALPASVTSTTPALSPDARVTTGWVESAINIAPSFPAV